MNRRDIRQAISITVCLLLIALGGPSGAAEHLADHQDILIIKMVDVGQGDAMILHQPDRCTVLIDAGGLRNGHRVTGTLQKMGIAAIDLAIISHPHIDHFGGLFDVAPRVPIRRLVDNGATNQNRDFFDDYTALGQSVGVSAARRGDRFSCGSLDISVLYPPLAPPADSDINSGSLALLIAFHGFRLLHLGDLTGAGETELIALGDDLSADLLKVAHHGAGDGTSSNLVNTVKPTMAVISCAPDNHLGAPAQTVIKRLADHGTSILRTDQQGTISLTVSARNGGPFSLSVDND